MEDGAVSQSRRGCVHEAGHAVFFVITETPFEYVEVKPHGAGHVFEGRAVEDELLTPTRKEHRCHALIALAGEMAERSILRNCDEPGLAKDRVRMSDALRGLARDEAHKQELEKRCRLAVEELFQRTEIRASIKLVAETLARKSRLSSASMKSLVSEEARRVYREYPDFDIE